jgi:hypothetical protein
MHLREYARQGAGMSLADGLNFDHHSRVSRWRSGTRVAYCNSGPAVAAAIVEKLSGERERPDRVAAFARLELAKRAVERIARAPPAAGAPARRPA